MRVDLNVSESVTLRDLPLKGVEIRRLFALLSREKALDEVRNQALSRLGTRAVGSLGLRFCDDKEMRGLQRRYRNLDRTTDVLSFPSLEVPGIGEIFSKLSRNERSWGDLVVSLETVKRGASRAGRKDREELAEVLIHGYLHLLGLDHVVGLGVSARDAKKMKALQAQLFKTWKSSGASRR